MKRIIRLGFRLLYNEMAWTYDPVAWSVSLGRWKAWGRTSIKHLRGRRVLELAHGPGHLLVALAQAGFRPVGIDLSSYMSRQALRQTRRLGIHVPLVRCRAQALPFRSGEFDSVVATFPTEYIADPLTLHEVARVTDPEGRLVIVAGAKLLGRQPSVRFIDWLYRFTLQSRAPTEGKESVFQQAGLPVQIEQETVGSSTVILLVADKAHT